MKNEVRPIDANATIEALRANFQQGSWYGCEEPGYQIAEETVSEMPTIGPYPAHIDWEAWEPCGEMCRNNCATCNHNADELFGDADYCKDCHRYSKWESSIHKYCERCGRPRTPEARAELEKRMGLA